MKVTYLANSCFKYNFSNGKVLLTDPWLLSSCNQTWFNFPPVDVENVIKDIGKVDYIFISHLHEDHLHPHTLAAFPADTKFIIGKLNTPNLRAKILSCGFKNIIECPLFEETIIDGIKFYIYPDFNGSTVGDNSELNYHLDTSLVTIEDDVKVFNAIDNTLLAKDSAELEKLFGKFDLAIIPYASASLFPMAMLDYSNERKKDIANSFKAKFLDVFVDNANALNAKYIVPAGGEFVLGGKSAHLTEFQPAPTPKEIKDYCQGKIKSKLEILYYFDQIDLADNSIKLNEKFEWRDWNVDMRLNYANSLTLEVSAYEKLSWPADIPFNWGRMLAKCKRNLLREIEKRKLNLSYKVSLKVKTDNKNVLEFNFSTTDNAKNEISFELDEKLLFMIITGHLNWNNVESSALIGVRRNPDQYNIDLHSSMVFFSL